MQTAYAFHCLNRRICKNSESYPPIEDSADLPNISFGDVIQFTFTFSPGTISEGDIIHLGLDNDMFSGLAHGAMAHAVHTVTAAEAASKTIVMDMETKTVKFLDVVNGKRNTLCHLGVYAETDNDAYVTLGECLALAYPVVVQPGEPEQELPASKYYTKAEIDDIISNAGTGGNGLSSPAAERLLAILRAAAYVSDPSDDISALAEILTSGSSASGGGESSQSSPSSQSGGGESSQSSPSSQSGDILITSITQVGSTLILS